MYDCFCIKEHQGMNLNYESDGVEVTGKFSIYHNQV
jgi:hypothetical protein